MSEQTHNQIKHRSREANRAEARQRVEQRRQVRVERTALDARKMLGHEIREQRRREQHDHDHVRAQPRQHRVRPAVPVVVVLLRRRVAVLLLGGRLDAQYRLARAPYRIDVVSGGRNFDFKNFFSVLVLDFLGASKVLRGPVVTFCSPTKIVPVVKKILATLQEKPHCADTHRLHMAYITINAKKKKSKEPK